MKPFVDIIISLCLVKSPKGWGTFAQHPPKKLRVEPLNPNFSPLFMNIPDSYPIHIPFILRFSGLVSPWSVESPLARCVASGAVRALR